MNKNLLAELDAEIARLQEARDLLAGNEREGSRSSWRSAASGRKHILSAKGRKAIADAQRRRWAKAREAKAA